MRFLLFCLALLPLVSFADARKIPLPEINHYPDLSDQPVIGHYSGTSGVPFPDKIHPMIYYPRESIKRALLERFAEQAVLAREVLAPSRLPDCPESKTVALPYKNYKNPKVSRAKLDLIFVRENHPAAKLETEYGQRALMNTVGEEYGSQGAYLAIGMKVKCLPFRMRLTDRARYIHFGSDAFKNFDNNPDGPGVKVKWKEN